MKSSILAWRIDAEGDAGNPAERAAEQPAARAGAATRCLRFDVRAFERRAFDRRSIVLRDPGLPLFRVR